MSTADMFRMKGNKDQDDKDVRHIMKTLKDEGYTTERLNKMLTNDKAYIAKYGKHGGCRGTRNAIRATEILLTNEK